MEHYGSWHASPLCAKESALEFWWPTRRYRRVYEYSEIAKETFNRSSNPQNTVFRQDMPRKDILLADEKSCIIAPPSRLIIPALWCGFYGFYDLGFLVHRQFYWPTNTHSRPRSLLRDAHLYCPLKSQLTGQMFDKGKNCIKHVTIAVLLIARSDTRPCAIAIHLNIMSLY